MTETERLSRSDTVFLDTQTEITAMQIGTVAILEGPVDFDRYVSWLVPRLEALPRLRQVLRAPFLRSRCPAWVDDPTVDIRDHIEPIQIETPGTDEQLRVLLTELYQRRLPITEPLWKLYVVNGLEGGRSAILLMTHHCVADGAGIMEIMQSVFHPGEDGWAQHVQAEREDIVGTGSRLVPLRAMRSLASRRGRAGLMLLMKYMRSKGPWFPFSRPMSGRLNLTWRRFSLSDIRAIARALEGTSTDVLLCVFAGAIDRYARDHEINVADSYVRLQVPANVRTRAKYGELSNELGMLPVAVPLGIDDPRERFKKVAEQSTYMKTIEMAGFMHGMMNGMLSIATPPGQLIMGKVLASRPYLKMERRFARSPREHSMLSSVVMHPVVYHADGQPVSQIFAFIPCQFSMGLTCLALAYQDVLTVSFSGDAESLPELETLADYFESAMEELIEAVAVDS